MPLSYGGGLDSLAICETPCGRGIEKLVFGTRALDGLLTKQVSASLGSQAVIGCIDYRGTGAQASTFVQSGRHSANVSVSDAAARIPVHREQAPDARFFAPSRAKELAHTLLAVAKAPPVRTEDPAELAEQANRRSQAFVGALAATLDRAHALRSLYVSSAPDGEKR